MSNNDSSISGLFIIAAGAIALTAMVAGQSVKNQDDLFSAERPSMQRSYQAAENTP